MDLKHNKNKYYEFIRSFEDKDVKNKLGTTLLNKKVVDYSAKFLHPLLYQLFSKFAIRITKNFLNRNVSQISTINDYLFKIALHYSEKLIKRSVQEITFSGTENIPNDKNRGCLLISNHRDIICDSIFTQYTLLKLYGKIEKKIFSGVGDNLLFTEDIENLYKLMRAFMIKRNFESPKEMVVMLDTLSKYIKEKIQEKNIVWLAQSPGRSKDSSDITNPSIIKMLQLAYRKQYTLQEMMEFMNIVPVTISYEYDPCDVLKANELYHREKFGKYNKEKNEDKKSMMKGILGYKGNIHVHFGKVVRDSNINSINMLSETITNRIHNSYKIFSSSLTAYWIKTREEVNLKKKEMFSINQLRKMFQIPEYKFPDKKFMKKYYSIEKKLRKFMLLNYSNPVYAAIEYFNHLNIGVSNAT